MDTRSTGSVVGYEEYYTTLLNVIESQKPNDGQNNVNTPSTRPPLPELPICMYCGANYYPNHNCRWTPPPPPPPPPLETSLQLLAQGVRNAGANKGDIIITLAGDDGSSYVHPIFLSATWSNRNPDYQVGHVGVLNFKPKISDSDDAILNGQTIEAWHGPSFIDEEIENQVMNRKIREWSNATAVYIVGVQHWKLRWKWQGLQSGLHYVYTPVQNPTALAIETEKYLGTPYSSYSSFGWSKWRAPSSFQCASLVWYCAKDVYGCRLAPYLSPTVTPGNIFFDRNTYIKKRIIVKTT